MSSQRIVAQVDTKEAIDVNAFEVAPPHVNGSIPDKPTQESDAALGALTDRLRSLHALGLSGATTANALRDIAQHAGVDTFTMALRRVDDLRAALAMQTEEKLQEFLASCGGNSPYWQAHAFSVSAYMQREPKQYLVENLIGVRDMGMIFGESGTGKTFVMLDMIRACARGDTFADKFTVARPLRIVYCTGEGHGGLVNRLRAALTGYEDAASNITIFDAVPQLFEASQENGLMTLLTQWPSMVEADIVPAQPDIFVIDTLFNSLESADENSAKDMSVVFKHARILRDTLGCAVIMVHHSGKNGLDYRGSSSIKGEQDVMLRTQKSGKSYQLYCEKLKDSEPWPAQGFDLVAVGDTGSARVFWEGDATSTNLSGKGNKLERQILSHLKDNAPARYTADEIAQAIGADSRTAVQNQLKALRTAGSIIDTKEDRCTKDGAVRKVFVYWTDSK